MLEGSLVSCEVPTPSCVIACCLENEDRDVCLPQGWHKASSVSAGRSPSMVRATQTASCWRSTPLCPCWQPHLWAPRQTSQLWAPQTTARCRCGPTASVALFPADAQRIAGRCGRHALHRQRPLFVQSLLLHGISHSLSWKGICHQGLQSQILTRPCAGMQILVIELPQRLEPSSSVAPHFAVSVSDEASTDAAGAL